MKILTKNCIVCGKKYTKRVNTSKTKWAESKFCSRRCINTGRIPHNKYLKPKFCENCDKLFNPRENSRKYCSRICARAKQIITKESRQKAIATRIKKYGYIHSLETRKKIRQAFSGSRSHFWKGGISKENYRLRRTARYKDWRKAVYERDNYTCQNCFRRGGRLQAHHIKSWEKYPELRFEVSNGITLCISCHKQTDSYARNFGSAATS